MRRKKVYMRVSALTTVNIPRDIAEQKRSRVTALNTCSIDTSTCDTRYALYTYMHLRYDIHSTKYHYSSTYLTGVIQKGKGRAVYS